MALELDGKPYRLSKEDLSRYSKRHVFRVGMQHIKVNYNPELPPIEVSPIHIMNEYRHYRLDQGVREPIGKLTYFEVKNYNQDTKKDEYYPPRIGIGYKGYIESIDPELNYFLDNHPNNEVVKSNPEHPNFTVNAETYFSTFNKENKRNELVKNIKLASELSLRILDRKEYAFDNLKSLAMLVSKSANDYHMVHKFYSVDDKDEADLRAELARLCSQYPMAMKEMMDSKKINFVEYTNKFISLGLIKLINDEWYSIDNTGKQSVLMKVPGGHDSIHSLADWFQNIDTKRTKFNQLKDRHAQLSAKLNVQAAAK